MPTSQPIQRLVYGASPAVESGHGEVCDLASLNRFAVAAKARTWRELIESFYETSYEDFIDEYDVEVGEPDDAPDFGEWYVDAIEQSPQAIAWDVAGRRIAALAESNPRAYPGVISGGGSPAGEDSISGPLTSLDALAEAIDPVADHFTLERNDEAIGAVFNRLYA